jgi:hypothetical protein
MVTMDVNDWLTIFLAEYVEMESEYVGSKS